MSLQQIYERKPLVYCITNYVVANFTANGLLAIGASPVMADAEEEVTEMTSISNGLLINIGTLNERTVSSMKMAIAQANKLNIPVVLDPVGAGATSYRLQTTLHILSEYRIALLRCNAGELAAIAGLDWQSKGVDSGSGDENLEHFAKEIASRYQCLVIVTGAVDILTDGQLVSLISGGHEKITKITGTGCLLSAICAASLASSSEPFQQLTKILSDYKEAAERAVERIGTYQSQFLNELERLAGIRS